MNVQPQFEPEDEDFPLPPIVFDPGEADECERDVSVGSYNYQGLFAIGKPKRKKHMALVVDADELDKANRLLAVNAAHDFSEGVKAPRLSLVENFGASLAAVPATDAAPVGEADEDDSAFAPSLDDFDQQTDAALAAWSTRTVVLSDPDAFEPEVAFDLEPEPVEVAREPQAPVVEPEPVLEPEPVARPAPVAAREPVIETPVQRAPVEEAYRPAYAAEPEYLPEPEYAPQAVTWQEPEFEPVAEPASPAQPAFEQPQGHTLRARIVRETEEASYGGTRSEGLLARLLAWLSGLFS